MLTYDLSDNKEKLYKQIYRNIKEDIARGKLKANEKMPSKRTLAQNLSVSTITVEHAYDQLVSEGYIYAVPRKGYFVSELETGGYDNSRLEISRDIRIPLPREKGIRFDFSSNQAERDHFPFSVWAKLLREVISLQEEKLLTQPPCCGVAELREALTRHLLSFRGLAVDPAQIIVGAGTEYLYSLIVKLLGTESTYCIENPGYQKLKQIYRTNGVRVVFAGMDAQGIRTDELRRSGADIAHISPTHHFPTGITMPAARRYELLAWANESKGRYIIEDDYDSEFRLTGKPIPALAGADDREKVIYMNTFSKSLASTIRISYMVLPEHLARRFYEDLSFYSCTVSTFEQYTLAAFIDQGYLEKHINRMRRYYRKKREKIFQVVHSIFSDRECKIVENDSGLHMILQFETDKTDVEIKKRLWDYGIRISTVSDYDMLEIPRETHQFLLNYSNIDLEELAGAMKVIRKILLEE